MEEMEKSWEQKLAEQSHKQEEEEKEAAEIQAAKVSGKPQILNLNEDGMLDRKIFLDLSKHTSARIGRKQPNPDDNPEITLGGIGISSQHACFQTNGDRTSLVPASAESARYCYINGEPLSSSSPVELKPNDRVIFGTGTVLLYRVQNRDSEVQLTDTAENPITYEFAMNERRKIEDKEEEARKAEEKERIEAENAAKMDALRAEMEKEKAASEAIRMAAQQEMEAKMAALKAEVDAKKDDE